MKHSRSRNERRPEERDHDSLHPRYPTSMMSEWDDGRIQFSSGLRPGPDVGVSRDGLSREMQRRRDWPHEHRNEGRYARSARDDHHYQNNSRKEYDPYGDYPDPDSEHYAQESKGASDSDRGFRPSRHEYSRDGYGRDSRGLYGSSGRGMSDYDRDSYGRSMTSRTGGEFAGRGPKGYRRSDERIKEDVCDALTRDAYVDASEIEVDVKDGEVTLSGTVPDRSTKRQAEDAIQSVNGVKDVINNLRLMIRQQERSRTEEDSPQTRSSPYKSKSAEA